MKKLLNVIFVLCIAAAVILGVCYIVVQTAAVVTVNGSLALWAQDYLEAPVCIMCSLAAIAAFLMSYVFHWKSGD